MHEELSRCISELQENHTDREIAGALSEYFQIVKSVSEDYTDAVTVAELREDHPELDFMDDDEIEEILEQAKTMRHKRKAAEEEYLTKDDMDELLRHNPDWLNAEADDQGYRIMEVAESTSIEALAGMVWVCTGSEGITVDKIKQTMLKYLEAKQMKEQETDKEKRREEIFQKILEETKWRNRKAEEALKLIAENKHGEATGLIADLDDQIIKDLYQEYWDLR